MGCSGYHWVGVGRIYVLTYWEIRSLDSLLLLCVDDSCFAPTARAGQGLEVTEIGRQVEDCYTGVGLLRNMEHTKI